MTNEKNLTMKDTKQVIFDALQSAEKKIKALEEGKLDLNAGAKAKKVAETISSAEETVAGGNIEEQITMLKRDFGKILDKIGGGLSEQVKKYANIQEAVELKEARLKELLDLETETFSLVAVVNAKEELARDYDEKLAQRKAEAEKEIADLQESFKQTRATLVKEISELKEKTQKEREREEEEYNYEFNRKKQKAIDTLNDEIESKKRAFNEKCEAFTKELNGREAGLDEREEVLEAREAKANDLEAQVVTLKEVMKKEIEEATESARKEEASKYYREKAFIEREANHQKEILESKLETQQEALDVAKANIAALTEKLEKAYAEIREIANKTIDNAGYKKVINQLERLVQNQKTSN